MPTLSSNPVIDAQSKLRVRATPRMAVRLVNCSVQSVTGPQDGIYLRVFQCIIKEVPGKQTVIGPWLEQIEREPAQRLIQGHAVSACRHCPPDRLILSRNRSFLMLFECLRRG